MRITFERQEIFDKDGNEFWNTCPKCTAIPPSHLIIFQSFYIFSSHPHNFNGEALNFSLTNKMWWVATLKNIHYELHTLIYTNSSKHLRTEVYTFKHRSIIAFLTARITILLYVLITRGHLVRGREKTYYWRQEDVPPLSHLQRL